MFTVAALYKFTHLKDYKALRQTLDDLCKKNKIFGTLLLAEEGINGTVSGSPEAIDILKNFLQSDPRFLGTEYKESFSEKNPFNRMKTKLKKEIVTLGQPKVDPNKTVGTYVDAKKWNELVNDPDVTVIDVRNDYEVEIGTFKNALDPKTKTFREFPDFVKKNLDPQKNKKVAMFCTGGIRCEKASSYMKQEGFENVYHLKGGILKYLEDTKKDQSTWNGECFVFDQRVAVNHDLEKGRYDMCFGCRLPLSAQDKQSEKFVEGVCCERCAHLRSEKQIKTSMDRQKQIRLAKMRGQQHLGQQI